MKTIIKSLLVFTLIFVVTSCRDLEELNIDPNNPAEVSTATLMTGAQKKMMDNIYDNWFSGRQALPYAQYWAQRTYTEEDRYQIRESVNNGYFNTLYTVAANLTLIEKINTDPATKVGAAVYGNNNNQIAAAKILKVWLMQVIADTWGSVPYSEAFKLTDGVVYAKYDDLNVLYPQFISELNAAIALIDENEVAFVSGDMIYDGDASKWKLFANSLKCRIALRMSKVNATWKTHIAEAIASGVFTSNADNAVFSYLGGAPDQCNFYKGFFDDGRNDFSITKPFTDLLKGQRDTLNNKVHPWENVVDPRLPIYTSPRGGKYIGLPYGLRSNQMTSAIRNAAPSFYSGQPLVVQARFTVPFMTYAELCFILSEYNGFSATEYEAGVRASFGYWNDNYTKAYGIKENPISDATIDSYVTAVTGVVNAETVATQKYIHLYMCGTEAWAEYRRTGYPTTMLKPGEYSHRVGGVNLVFEPLSEVKGDLPARVKYPTNESTLNGDNFNAAVAKLQDGTNNYYSKMFWDVRTAAIPHPANK
jgi:hypothetical protein